jgi:hypothetical protein
MQIRTAGERRVHARSSATAQQIDALTSRAAVSGSVVGKALILGYALGAIVGTMGGSGLPAVNLYSSCP